MADETPVSQPLSQDETRAQLKTAIQALENLADRLDGESAIETEATSPILTQLTDTVANLTAILEPSSIPEPEVEEVPVEEQEVALSLDVDVADEGDEAVVETDIPPDDVVATLADLPDREDENAMVEISAPSPVAETPTPEPIAPETDSSEDWGSIELDETPSENSGDATVTETTTPGLLNTVVQKIRGILPSSLNEMLPDTAIIVSAVGLVVVLLWGVVALSSSAPSESIAELPEPAPEMIDLEPVQIPATQTPSTQTPSTPIAPIVPTTPPRKLRLSPEQKLIASIQKQVSQITEQYAEGLIQSLQVDFLAGRLRVTISEDWYDLEPERQDQVAAEVLERAHRLDFTKVEMVDNDAHTLARSPLIGDRMIIFQRVLSTGSLLSIPQGS